LYYLYKDKPKLYVDIKHSSYMKTTYAWIVSILLLLASINVTFAQILTAEAGPDTLLCTGESYQIGGTPISTGGTPPHTYLWSPQAGLSGIVSSPIATPSTTTTYTLYVTDALGTTASDYVTVTTTPNPNFEMEPDSLLLHHYFITNLTTGVAPLAYLWSWGDGTTDTMAYPSHTYSTAGYYNVCLTVSDGLGCTHTYCDSSYLAKADKLIISVEVIAPIITNVNGNEPSDQILIYPNPTTNDLFIEAPPTAIIELIDMSGQIIQTTHNYETRTRLCLQQLSRGVYIVRIKTNNIVVTKKIIKGDF
jgi:hypothetical protein